MIYSAGAFAAYGTENTDSRLSETGKLQVFPDFPSENPTIRERDDWVERSYRNMSAEMAIVARGGIPAKYPARLKL